MSTRRARIKAVAALPQRRKNTDNAGNKLKQEQAKELAEIAIKSPKAGRATVEKAGSSPARAAASPRLLSPRKSPRAPVTPEREKVSDWKVPTPTSVSSDKRSSTPLRDKSESNKSSVTREDVFLSPQARASPLRKGPTVIKTPIIEVEVSAERNNTAHKSVQDEPLKHSQVPENRENILSPKPINNSVKNGNARAKNITEGYNSPKTPENDVMDGIVPLKSVSNAPKPIELLKSEIISENAEVLFDPIVPLPSPTKVRQKLRPVPRLGPMRRNSIPGSASESEDESRRAHHGGSSTPVPSRQRHDSHTSHSTISHPNRDVSRVRNDSMCSSQMAPQTPAPGSPMKEKGTKTRRIDVSRRMAAMRRRKESLQRDKLTMFDLIFYNPLTNPIVPDQDELKAKEATKKEEEQRKLESSKKEENNEDSNEATEDSSAPVPQIKLGPNGEIILDEQSLVIKQSEQRKLSDSVVHEGAWMSSTGKVYRRTPRTADWNDAETVRFYRALAALGTDFSLMVALFPGRSRRDLKHKFKKEEKNNLAQIDKALRSVSEFNADRLEAEFAEERRKAEERAQRMKEMLKEEKRVYKEQNRAIKDMKIRQSKGSKALGMSVIPDPLAANTECITADDIILETIKPKARPAKRRRDVKAMPMPIPALHPIQKPQMPSLNPIQKSHPASLTASKRIPPHQDMPPIQRPQLMSPPNIPYKYTSPASIQRNPFTPSPNVHSKSPIVSALPNVPADIAPGSLVVLTVEDPKAPSKKAIHTYIKQADGSIASVVLDSNVMSSLVSYVKNDTPRGSSVSSASPNSVISDRNTPPVGVSPRKRPRHTSYTITDL